MRAIDLRRKINQSAVALVGCKMPKRIYSRISFLSALTLVCVLLSGWCGFSSFAFALPQSNQESTEKNEAEHPQSEKSEEKKKSKRKKKSDEETDPVKGISFSNPVESKWQIGAVIVGGAGSAQNMLLTIPVPNDWPEQTVTVMEEKIPRDIGNAEYRDLRSGVRQLVISIPKIRANQKIPIAITILVSSKQITAPPDPTKFIKAKSKSRTAKEYLGISPQIKVNSKIRKLVKKITEDKSNPWEEVKAIYDWVGDNITEIKEPAKDSAAVLKSKEGGNESMTGLFIAMCRAHKIPARMVWVQGTQYAEFMLTDAEENAHWIPCSLGGFREFGSVTEPRIILQKGDSIYVPEKKRNQKFVAEFATCQGNVKPRVQFFRRVLADE